METFKAKDTSVQMQQSIQGSCYSDHVMLESNKSRELRLKYSGYSLNRKCTKNPKNLTSPEFKQLLALFEKGALPLAQFTVTHLQKVTSVDPPAVSTNL